MSLCKDIEQNAGDQCNRTQNPVLCTAKVSGTGTTGKGICTDTQQAETDSSYNAGRNDG